MSKSGAIDLLRDSQELSLIATTSGFRNTDEEVSVVISGSFEFSDEETREERLTEVA